MPPVQETTPSYHLFTASSSSGQKLSNTAVDSIETSIFNMMVRSNITEFGGVNYSSQVPSSDIVLPEFEKHIVISNYEPDFGTTWAVRANHVDGTSPSSVNGLKNNFTTDIGHFGSTFNARVNQTYNSNTLNNKIYLDNESTTYYDSHLRMNFADGVPAVTTGADTYREISNGSVTVRFDDADEHYNAFKAANSFLSSGSKNIQHGLQITDYTSFNSSNGLLASSPIVRDANNNRLSIGETPYEEFFGHTLNVVTTPNADVFFGALKFQQVDATIEVDKSTVTALRTSAGAVLPTAFTSDEFNTLFEVGSTTQRLSDIGDRYSLSIEGVSGGGYATVFRGFSLDDSELTVNTDYMSAITSLTGAEHNIQFVNGSIALTSDTSSNNAFFAVSDIDETLEEATYNTSGSVVIYHNTPESRAQITGTDASSGRITALRTTYTTDEPSYSAAVGVLSAQHKATSNVSFDVECLLKTTSSDSDVSQTSSNSLYIGNKTNHSFYIPTTNTALNGSEITITNVANDVITADVKLFQIKQSYLMAGESPLYSIVNGTPTSNDATTSVSLTGLNMSTLPSKDMRVVVKPKTASELSTWAGPNAPFWSHSNANDKCLSIDPNMVSFMSAYELFELPHKLELTYAIDQFGITVEQMRRSLVVVSSGNGTYDDIEYTDNSPDMTKTNEPSEPIYREVVTIATFNPLVTGNTIRNSTDKKFKYKGKSRARITLVAEMTVTKYNLSVLLPYGQYSNLSLNTATSSPIYETTIKIYLLEDGPVPKEVIASFRNVEVNTDATAPVDKTINFTFTDKTGFSATSISDTEELETSLFFSEDKIRSRKFISYEKNNISSLYYLDAGYEIKHSCDMTSHDLYTAAYYLESQAANGSWVKYNSIAERELDLCYGTEISYNGITLSVEMGSDVIGGTNEFYYIDMAVTKGASTYSVSGYTYNAADLSSMDSTWSPYSNDNFYLPISVGTEIANLSTDIVTHAPVLGGQSTVTLKILKDAIELFQLDCATNIIANINIVGTGGPIFKVVETTGDSGAISGANASSTKILDTINPENNSITRYIVGGKTYTKIVDGIEVRHASTVDRGDKCTLALLGDSISASLYSGYNGTFTTKTALTKATGNIVEVAGCNTLTAAFYRGLKYVANVNDSDRETIAITRTPTTATFIVSVGMTNYSQNLGDVYKGRIYVIDTLSTLGGIGLKLTANNSRFTSLTALSQPVTNTFGSYNITNSNPLISSTSVVSNISASAFTIYSYTGTNPLNIVAGCVKVSETEKYKITYYAYGIAVYKSVDNYVCDATQILDADWTLFNTYSDTTLRAGVTFNHIRLVRTALNVQDMVVAYVNCPRPQLKVDAISRLDINDLAYGSNVPLQTYYIDIDFAAVKEPFKINNTVVSGLNNIKVLYNTVETYTSKRLNADGTVKYMSIPSNKITVALYPNFSTNNIDYATAVPLATVINDKHISELDATDLQTGLFAGAYNTATLSASFRYAQPLDIFTSSLPMENGLTPSLYADDRMAVKNIMVNNVNAFTTGTGILDMNPGDSISLDVYGLRLSPVKSTINDISVTTGMRVTFIKYSTDYSIDFYNPEVQSIVKELHISPTKRFTKSVVVSVPPFVYSTTTTLMDRMLTGVVLGSTWSEETLSTIKPLETRISAIDGRGKELILKLLAVGPQYPMNLLLISQPDLINFKSATGATKFRVNYNGVLMVNRIQNEQLLVQTESADGAESPNLAPELFLGKVTAFSAP
jgi:hypothetical protein